MLPPNLFAPCACGVVGMGATAYTLNPVHEDIHLSNNNPLCFFLC